MTKPKDKPQKVVTQVELVIEIDGELFENTSWLNDLRNYLVENTGWIHVNVLQKIVEGEVE
ncbi:hypothetical protein LCGC14_2197700 [marine sediment metagenome]|uniref:Uncharacterized protein n=1 Tax=marine sediment metagenome TaxID=412755 RepID=A0A0F9E4S6_9ZZZZ